jgi:predicted DNA-binding transcriptional regulator AlpA
MATPATIVETATETDDRLLTVQECAERLRKSTKWVYRRTRTLPFAICLGPRSWVFSQKGLEKWLAKQRA